MDWVATVANEAKTGPTLRIRDLATKYRLSSSAVARALVRQKKRGLLEQLTSDTYLNKLAPAASPHDVLNTLVPDSYISLGSALAEWGVSTQSFTPVSALTASKLKKIKSPASTSSTASFTAISSGVSSRRRAATPPTRSPSQKRRSSTGSTSASRMACRWNSTKSSSTSSAVRA